MGEVYRAHDARLDRDVAVKVLPTSLSGNPEVRARFEREAKTISSLNHPHICVLHDVGREGDIDFLVMELVEGETLAERLLRGPLPTNEVLTIGQQIADALDRAHRAGVVHRDLKPGNIMLTRSGAKLMDFGLARVTGLAAPGGQSGVAPMTQSPTVAHPLTAEGTIIGTFQYMAPEQLEGGEADERADVWALGCVLHEMATGQRAFDGKSQASLIAGIMHTEPAPVSQIAALSPPALDRLVTACLAKDPAERVQSAHDIKLQLSWMAEGSASVSGVAPPVLPKSSARSRWPVFALVVFATAVATALVTRLLLRDDANRPQTATPQRYILGSADLQPASVPTLSPDGTHVVFSVREGTSRRLYRRDLSTLEMSPVAGTDGGIGPFFSPDGAWIGFATDDAIKKVPAGGGIAQRIASYTRPSSGEWAMNGMIYFAARAGGEDGVTALARVAAAGGAVEVVAQLDVDGGESESWLPELLPDGETVLLSIIGAASSTRRIIAVRPDGSTHTAVPDAFLGRYIDSGHILYRDNESGAVLVAPFDPVAAKVTGSAVPLTEETDGAYCFDVSPDGKLVYVPLPGAGVGNEIVWLDRQGRMTAAAEMKATWAQPRVSPDGKRILLRKTGDDCELWMLDLDRGSLGRIVTAGDNHDAIWSPDGRRIAYERNDARRMVTLTVEGARETTTLAEGLESGLPQSWAAGLLAYTVSGAGTRTDIWVRAMDGSSAPHAFLATAAAETQPSFSPDGKWIAFQSDETGNAEVYIRAYPDAGTVWQVSNGGGGSPLWSRDGRELYYTSGAKLMAVAIETEPTLRVDSPEELLDGGLSTSRARDFDVAPDGRFVTVRTAGGAAGQVQLRILLNWPQEMARTAGAAR
jgi:serine/threonine protein kinase